MKTFTAESRITFASAELERDFIAFCQLASPFQVEGTDLPSVHASLLESAKVHRRYEHFDDADASERICGGQLLQTLEQEFDADQWQESDGLFTCMCATRVLSVAEEQSIMTRMHFLKYVAYKILTVEAIDQWAVARAQGLLRAAHWHRDLIVKSNIRLVVSIVKKMPVTIDKYDELISEGIMALLHAVDKFDPRRGYRLCTYATPVIRRACFHYLQEQNSERSQLRPALLLSAAQPDAMDLDRSHWLLWRKRLLGMIKNLSRREQVIIRSRYCLGSHREVKTLQRLAAALKISKERVRQLEHSALAKLKAWAEMA